MNSVSLPLDLERFADEAVARGRFRDVDEVVRAGVNLLQQSEAELAGFVQSLDTAKTESEQVGFRTLDQVMRDADTLLKGQRNYGLTGRTNPALGHETRFGFLARWWDAKGVHIILRGEGFIGFTIELNGDNLRYAGEAVRKEIEDFLALGPSARRRSAT